MLILLLYKDSTLYTHYILYCLSIATNGMQILIRTKVWEQVVKSPTLFKSRYTEPVTKFLYMNHNKHTDEMIQKNNSKRITRMQVMKIMFKMTMYAVLINDWQIGSLIKKNEVLTLLRRSRLKIMKCYRNLLKIWARADFSYKGSWNATIPLV